MERESDTDRYLRVIFKFIMCIVYITNSITIVTGGRSIDDRICLGITVLEYAGEILNADVAEPENQI